MNDLTLFDVMLLNSKGADLIGIATTDQSAGADGIVARAGIDSLTALKGKRIGASKGTYVEYMLSIVLAREGLAMSDVTLVDMPGEQALAERRGHVVAGPGRRVAAAPAHATASWR